MPNPTASRTALKEYYAEIYAAAKRSTWRDLGAVQKAENIVNLWSQSDLPPNPSVCEIGCGDGAVLARLDTLGFASGLVGYEIVEAALGLARQLVFRTATQLIACIDCELPAGPKQFDLAVLSHVVEHADEPRQLLREASRVARYVFVEVPLELHWRTPRDFEWVETGHINLYNPTVLRHLVQSSGMCVLAERITAPDYAVFRYQYGKLGAVVRWAAKRGLLAVPSLATNLFTYHGCLLASDSQRKSK